LIVNFIIIRLAKIFQTKQIYIKEKFTTQNTIQTQIFLKQKKINQCELEWYKLSENTFVRKNFSFYYPDLNKIKIYLERKRGASNNFKLLITIKSKELNNSIKQELDRVYYYPIRFDTHEYSFGYIEANLNYLNKIDSYQNLNIQVVARSNSFCSEPINLIVKYFNATPINNNNNIKKYSILCSKLYFRSNSFLQYYEWWININKINGFDKIVLFNNSYGSEFDNLFEKYKNLVQIVQYQCLPNFINNITQKPFINFFEFNPLFNKNPDKYHEHFECAAFNECLNANRDKYKYIAIIDDDEAIIPRRPYTNELTESSYQNYESFEEKNDPITNKPTKLIPYLEGLKSEFKLNSQESFGFRWAPYMKNKHIKIIFNEIEKISQSKSFNHTLLIQDSNDLKLCFKLTIKNEQDFKYAKYLYEMHLKYIEPFFKNNSQILNSVPEPYTRFYYFNGKETVFHSWYFKHIHDASEAFKVSTHLPENRVSSSLNVPVNLGHVTHFREDYREAYQWKQKEIPIKELFFDFVYFNNYFKPILKIVSLK
jgi:hypothetical protein